MALAIARGQGEYVTSPRTAFTKTPSKGQGRRAWTRDAGDANGPSQARSSPPALLVQELWGLSLGQAVAVFSAKR